MDKSLSRNTKLFVLLAIVTVIMSYIFQNRDTAIVIGSIMALFAVVLVDYFELLSKHHPQAWRVVKYSIIAIILLLTLIGFAVGI